MATISRHSHFLAHSSHVNCLRFGRKSGQVAATGGDDQLVNLWRMREKETKNIMSLSGHQSPVESLVFDPSERKVIAGSKAGSIKAFDLEAGKVSRTLKGHMSTCMTLDYHLYGDYVASGSLDTIVKVWDLRTKSCMQTFKGHQTEVTNVCFTPDGRWLTSGGLDGTIRIWDLTAGKLLREFSDHGGAITSLEFNPEEFILVSASTDKTLRFWDVQEFALIGVTPTDNATTTTMCHTVTEPYSGKYLFCCSPEAVRVWSYETAIECHDSVPCFRSKDVGAVEVHADTVMLEDMKLMGGSIQDAFVSIWVLDVAQMRPFNNASRSRPEPTRTGTPFPPVTQQPKQTVPPPPATSSNGSAQSLLRQSPSTVNSFTTELPDRAVSSSRPATPSVPIVPGHIVRGVSDPRVSAHVQKSTEFTPRVIDMLKTPEVANSVVPSADSAMTRASTPANQPKEEVATADYIMELRCGMDTCVKTFKARQKCMQQLLVYWEKGNLNDGFRYLTQLPNGKREALVVDLLRITDFHALGVDLEACVLLLPLVVELLTSKFDMYISVGIESGQKLFEAFSPIVKDSRDARPMRAREVNLAGEDRMQRCGMCDSYFQEMHHNIRQLADQNRPASLQSKIRNFARALSDFYR